MIGYYSTESFSDRFSNYQEFKRKYDESPMEDRLIHDEGYGAYQLDTIYALLASRYWADHMKSNNGDMFELRLFQIIWQHGPKWQRDMKLYDKVRNLTEDEMSIGSKSIHNHAQHPDTAPDNDSVKALPFIDSQNVTTYIKSPRDRNIDILELENSEITENFISRFSILFRDILYPAGAQYFET